MNTTFTVSAARRGEAAARLPTVLRAVVIAACVPYLILKIAWISGSHVGVPEGSELRDPDLESTLLAMNLVTVLMDATVVVLVLALTRPWGLRLPGWLLLAPLWIATGLLAPIAVAFPASAVAGLFTSSGGGGSTGGDGPFLDPWVFTVVYTGFCVQALGIGVLFAGYVRGRWGPALRGRLAEWRATGGGAAAGRATAVTAALLLPLPLTVHLLWLGGATAGLNAEQIADRDATFHIVAAMNAGFALAAVAGALLLAFRPARFAGLRLAGVMALTWVACAAAACWGGWLLVASALPQGGAPADEQATPLALLTYSGQMIVGLLVLILGARLLAGRAARTAPLAVGAP